MSPESLLTYWFVPKLLMAGAYPGSLDESEAREKIRWLFARGIRRFVDLTEEGEVVWAGRPLLPYAHLLADEARASGLRVEHRRFGIRDMWVPSDEGMEETLSYLDACVADNAPAYVHCLGGRGRTGTVVACHLLRDSFRGESRLTAEQALTRLTFLREQGGILDAWDSPQAPVQFEFVKAWEARLGI